MANRRARNVKPQLSVILVNYNVREFLRNALASLQRALKGIPSELLVVDNASTDKSAHMLRKEFPSVRLIANPANAGFAFANNQALRIARGEFFLLINPDTIVQENTIRTMLSFFHEHADAGLAGCKILNPDGTFQLPCRRSFPSPWVAFTKIVGLSSLFPRSRLFGKYNLTYLDPDATYEVDAVSGSFMMLRRSVYEYIGGLDEAFFMYGEDLDWCYRVQAAGWKVYYVHATSIIHYKGESARRSGLNETKMFYAAMDLFVNKYFSSSRMFQLVLRLGILISGAAAIIVSAIRSLRTAWVDVLLVDASLVIAEWIRRGDVFLYPSYAYPIVFVLPASIVVASLYSAGVYTHRAFSVSRSFVGTSVALIVVSALTAFFREYAFSRAIVLMSGLLWLVLLPGWRLTVRLLGGTRTKGIYSRRTLVVGVDDQARELIKRLRGKIAEGFVVVGCIGRSTREIGGTVGSTPILGSMENLPRAIRETRATDIIVAPGAASYRALLSAISETTFLNVSFHVVPNSMEVIIGKAAIDTLSDVPLVSVSYNIQKPFHRFSKRAADVLLSALLLCTLYPILYTAGKSRWRWFRLLPNVLDGSYSFVGPPEGDSTSEGLFYGKPGITGLVQLKGGQHIGPDEREQLHVFYARNQSLLLDAEILIKTLIATLKG